MNDSLPLKEDLSETDLRNSNIPYIKRKILLLGGQGVGKTAIINKFKNNIFTEDYEQTIQITTKKVITLNNDYIDLEIVDFEGQTEYTIFSPNKFSFGYNGYMLVYDVKDKKSFELINFIYEQINNLSGKTSKILVGTKCDNDLDLESISYRQVPSKEGKKLAEKIHCPFIEISSKDNKNIEEAFRLLLIEINKTESGINLKKLKFLKIFQFFIHHPKLTIYSYYINLIFFILLSFILLLFGIVKEIDIKGDKNYFFGTGFPFTISGLWGILFSLSGIFGIYNKNIYLLELNHYASIINVIYLLLSICQIVIICLFQDNNESKSSYILNNILILVISILPLILITILSKIFKIIYQNDLQSYMA